MIGLTPSAPPATLADLLRAETAAVDRATAAVISQARGDDALPGDALLILADALEAQASSYDLLCGEADHGQQHTRAAALANAASARRLTAATLRSAAQAIAGRPLRLAGGSAL